jgi:hypothetical protein
MNAQILGIALALATACLLLWFREVIVALGKTSMTRQRGQGATDALEANEFYQDEHPQVCELGAGISWNPARSSIQVEEFLAELRASATRPQGDEPDRGLTAHPQGWK